MAETEQPGGESPARPNRRRRRLALSLRGMLLVVLALAAWLGWWVSAARRQQAAVAALQTAPYSGSVTYDDEPDYLADDAPFHRRLWRAVKRRLPGRLEALLGRDYYHNVLNICVTKDGPPSPADRAIFRRLALAQSLEGLSTEFEIVDEDVVQIARLPQLRHLQIYASAPRLTGASLRALAGMPRLEWLEILDAPITDAALAELKEMRELSILTLGDGSRQGNGVAIRGDGLAHLAGLPFLTSLQIDSAALGGEGLKPIGRLKHLVQLDLDGDSIVDDDLRFLAPLPNLESLRIAGAGIDGTGFRHLIGLTKIDELCLEGRNVTDAAIPFLARLPALEHLMLYNTRVTASGLEKLRSAPRLVQLDVLPDVTGKTHWKHALPGCQRCKGVGGF